MHVFWWHMQGKWLCTECNAKRKFFNSRTFICKFASRDPQTPDALMPNDLHTTPSPAGWHHAVSIMICGLPWLCSIQPCNWFVGGVDVVRPPVKFPNCTGEIPRHGFIKVFFVLFQVLEPSSFQLYSILLTDANKSYLILSNIYLHLL